MGLSRGVIRSTQRASLSRAIGSDGGATGGGAANPAYQILVKTNNAGTSTSTQFTFPATGTYTIDWGDGTVEELTGSQTHTYPEAGEYVVKVTGGLTAVTFNNGGDRLKLLEIQNWGDIAWSTMANAYYGCSNMLGTFTDSPDMSAVTSMNVMFRGCTNFNADISSWDVGTVTQMNQVFFGATAFNQNIGSWNVGSVQNFSFMFYQATSFNQDISSWSVGAATTFSNMFFQATAFDQNIGSWDVRLVTTMASMFQNAALSTENYDALLIGWESQAVKNNVSFHGGASEYTAGAAAAARAALIADHNWTITDGGQVL